MADCLAAHRAAAGLADAAPDSPVTVDSLDRTGQMERVDYSLCLFLSTGPERRATRPPGLPTEVTQAPCQSTDLPRLLACFLLCRTMPIVLLLFLKVECLEFFQRALATRF